MQRLLEFLKQMLGIIKKDKKIIIPISIIIFVMIVAFSYISYKRKHTIVVRNIPSERVIKFKQELKKSALSYDDLSELIGKW